MTSVPRSIRQRTIFVDTSAFYALLDQTDQWHERADAGFRALGASPRPLYTSNLVVAETYGLIQRSLGAPVATRWLASLDINFVFPTEEDHRAALQLLSQHQGLGFSYVDASSFVIMEKTDIGTAFAFDDHFRQYGWNLFTASES